ncbi:MAG: hypothetical protein O7A63_00005, partial [Acidobacteria bacterium]|nr:hypothetical protein [Acidobacteriota bacterium]
MSHHTPMGYFRPLTLASFHAELSAWGASPSLFHLTNLLLISGAAFLVVVLIRRYTGDGALAGGAGLLFALHPWHVENAAWIAARTDPLFSLFLLGALLTYDRWRGRLRGLPITCLVLFEAALLAKETAIVLPVFLLALGLIDRSRRATSAEWVRGYLPIAVIALAHFLVMRPLAIGETGLRVLSGFGMYWGKKLMGFAVAAVLPLPLEILESRPLLWGLLGATIAGTLCIAVFIRTRRIPLIPLAATLMFPILLGPSLISFQERFLFLPSAASALALASLLRACGRRVRTVGILLLVSGWLFSSGDHWLGWREAGVASSRLVNDLTEASHRPGAEEIVVANMPHRVRGAPVAGNFAAALQLSGGRPIKVIPATYVDYPTASSDFLTDRPESGSGRPAPYAEVRLRIPDERYARLVSPLQRG